MKKEEKTNLNNLSMEELVSYEKGARLIIAQYENMLRGYDCSIREDAANDYFKDFNKATIIHGLITDAIKKKLWNIE